MDEDGGLAVVRPTRWKTRDDHLVKENADPSEATGGKLLYSLDRRRVSRYTLASSRDGRPEKRLATIRSGISKSGTGH